MIIFEKSQISSQRSGSDGGHDCRADDGEIMIRNDLEDVFYMVKDLAMLPRHGDHWLKLPSLLQAAITGAILIASGRVPYPTSPLSDALEDGIRLGPAIFRSGRNTGRRGRQTL